MSENKIIEKFFYEKDGKTYFAGRKTYKKRKERKEYLEKFEIEQGDILTAFPDYFYENEYAKPLSLIVGTYTCDIQKPSTTRLHLLPIYPLDKLLITFLKNFIQTLKKTRINLFKDFKINNNNKKLSESFNRLNADEKGKYINYIKNIFQFKNRNFFLLCPHKLLNNKWCFVDVQNVIPLERQKIYPLIIKYLTISINSPWKEKFGSVIGSRFAKVAVDDFKSHEIRNILITQF